MGSSLHVGSSKPEPAWISNGTTATNPQNSIYAGLGPGVAIVTRFLGLPEHELREHRAGMPKARHLQPITYDSRPRQASHCLQRHTSARLTWQGVLPETIRLVLVS